jgi:RNA polymerase sigma factor (sigma-70 family)
MDPTTTSPGAFDGDSASRYSAAEWARLRARLLRELRRQIRADAETLEDLAQEACVRLIRAIRHDPASDPAAYVKVVAQRTGSDYLRGIYRQRRLMESVETGELELAIAQAHATDKGELIERLEFVVLELLEREQATECHQLARAWFDGRNWRDLAEQRKIAHSALRKRWSRCLERVRELLDQDTEWGPLVRWSERP